MSKQDYVRIAAIIANATSRTSSTPAKETVRCHIAFELAALMQADNPNFDRARFLKACEVEE